MVKNELEVESEHGDRTVLHDHEHHEKEDAIVIVVAGVQLGLVSPHLCEPVVGYQQHQVVGESQEVADAYHNNVELHLVS